MAYVTPANFCALAIKRTEMYGKGDLRKYQESRIRMRDSRGKRYVDEDGDICTESGDAEDGQLYLVHSCGEWVIGGDEQIEELIADLQAELDKRNVAYAEAMDGLIDPMHLTEGQ